MEVSAQLSDPIRFKPIRAHYSVNLTNDIIAGWETFLSYEDPEQDILVGLLRLRKCSDEVFRPELTGGVSVVRELHVYGRY